MARRAHPPRIGRSSRLRAAGYWARRCRRASCRNAKARYFSQGGSDGRRRRYRRRTRRGRPQTGVARVDETVVFRRDEPEVILLGDLGRGVGRAVVDDDDLVVGIIQLARSSKRVAYRTLAVVAQTTTENFGQRGLARNGTRTTPSGQYQAPLWARAPGRRDRNPNPRCRGHRDTIRPSRQRQTRPRSPRNAVRTCHSRPVPGRPRRCAAVQSDLGEHERQIAGDVLEARQIGRELPARLEKDIEAREIEERQLQVGGGRIVHVGDERGGCCCFAAMSKRSGTARPAAAVPAHDRSGDFVADRKAEDRRCPAQDRAIAHTRCWIVRACCGCRGTSTCCSQVRPARICSRLGCAIEKRAGGTVYVRTTLKPFAAMREIREHRLRRREVARLLVGPERAVRHAAHVHLGVALVKRLPAYVQTVGGGCARRTGVRSASRRSSMPLEVENPWPSRSPSSPSPRILPRKGPG